MKRKLIELGQGSIVVSIPSKFAKKNGLSKGKEIDIEEVSSSELILRAKEKIKETRKVTIHIKKKEEFMQRLIHRYYVAGYDELILYFEDPGVIDLIENVIDTLIGFEIAELGKDKCILKLVSTENIELLENIKRRQFLLILTTSEDSIAQIKGGKFDYSRILERFEKQTNKYSLFCERILNQGVIENLPVFSQTYCHVWTMEQIADELKEVWKISSVKNTEFSKELLNSYALLLSLLRMYYDAYYNNTLENVLNLKSMLKRYKEETNILDNKLDLIRLGHFTTILNMIHHLSLFILPEQK